MGRISLDVPFAAIDFELADDRPESVCAFAVVVVGDPARVTGRWLVRPATSRFTFTGVHGISAADVEGAPGFARAWIEAVELLAGVGFLAAHHASFDRMVLLASLRAVGLREPRLPWVCTRSLARRVLGCRSGDLAGVCGELAIPLRHHDPLSDAEAAAGIVQLARLRRSAT